MAVQSAIKHIPNFNELVIVVPTKDVANATKMFPNAASQRIKIVGEEDLLDSGHMQQK